MPRRARGSAGGVIYHVLNRAVGRMTLFRNDADYDAFERVMRQALDRFPMRLLCYCIMPNHWHLVLWPYEDGDLSRFMFWLTMTHAQRWRHARKLVGLGPLYQGRFRSFPVEEDDHYLILCRYAERNALRAGKVARAQDWRYSSLFVRMHPKDPRNELLSEWPVDRPDDWVRWLNSPQTSMEEEALRLSIRRNRPFGSPQWQRRIAEQLGLESCFRAVGRPRKSGR